MNVHFPTKRNTTTANQNVIVICCILLEWVVLIMRSWNKVGQFLLKDKILEI